MKRSSLVQVALHRGEWESTRWYVMSRPATYLFTVAFGSERSSSLLATGASLSDIVVVAVQVFGPQLGPLSLVSRGGDLISKVESGLSNQTIAQIASLVPIIGLKDTSQPVFRYRSLVQTSPAAYLLGDLTTGSHTSEVERYNDYSYLSHRPSLSKPLHKPLPVQPDRSHLDPGVCLALAKAEQRCFRLLVRNYGSHVPFHPNASHTGAECKRLKLKVRTLIIANIPDYNIYCFTA